MRKTARQVWDDEQIARAVGFTTSRFQGRGVYDTRRFDRLQDALADAAGDRRALVYAVTPEGWTIHFINGDKIATTETDMTTINDSEIFGAPLGLDEGQPLNETITAAALTITPDDAAAAQALNATITAALRGNGKRPVGASSKGIKRGVQPSGKATAKDAAKPADADAAKAPRAPRGQKRDKAIKAAVAKAAKPAKAPKAAKADKPAKAPKAAAPKALGLRAQRAADAAAGKLPNAPDFSAETHKRYRAKLAELVALIASGDVAAVRAYPINVVGSSSKAMDTYRNLAVIALEAVVK
jgi:hypothetical protein